MAINTGTHPKALWPGVKAFFGKVYAEKPMVCDMVFDAFTSDKAYEEYVEETGFGLAPVKAEGMAVSYDTDKQGYVARLSNVTYGLGASVTQEAIDDNQYENVAMKKAAKLARSMRQTKENVFANVLNRAFTAGFTGGDGSILCVNSHPTVNGTQSNVLTVAADLSESSLEDMLTQIRLATDSRGLRIQLRGTHLIVPPQYEFVANRIMKSSLQSGTANNDVNAIKATGQLPGGIVVWDYLSDVDAWFVKTDAETGLIRQQRKAMAFTQDNDFDTNNARMKSIERYAAGWADWRGVFGTPGV
jgi:hypothetical protein